MLFVGLMGLINDHSWILWLLSKCLFKINIIPKYYNSHIYKNISYKCKMKTLHCLSTYRAYLLSMHTRTILASLIVISLVCQWWADIITRHTLLFLLSVGLSSADVATKVFLIFNVHFWQWILSYLNFIYSYLFKFDFDMWISCNLRKIQFQDFNTLVIMKCEMH